jgi:hypothetical protein
MRRRLNWLVALPLMLAGTQVAHALAYRLVYPQAHAHLVQTGHGYLGWLPLVFGVTGALAVVGLAAAVADAARGRHTRELPAAAFALLPPTAFAVQELVELSLHTGTFGWRAFLAPTFLPGLALQLPFAVAAFVLARLLLRAAVEFGRALAPPRTAPIPIVAQAVERVLLGRADLACVAARAPPCAVVN